MTLYLDVGTRIVTLDSDRLRDHYRKQAGRIVSVEETNYLVVFDHANLNTGHTDGAMRVPMNAVVPELYLINELVLE